jgi:membrane-anchored protein YejM (alkaline phosphatase superfamily)
MKSKRKSKNNWFIPIRGSYLPASGWGWLSYIPFTGYLVSTFLLTYNLNIALAMRVYFVVIQWSFAGLIMTWLAKHKS